MKLRCRVETMYFQPNSQTGAGAFHNLTLKSGKPSDEFSNELTNWAKTQGRVFVINANSTFLFACATLLMMGFLSTLGPDTASSVFDHNHDRKLRYIAALAFVACMISAKQMRSIAKYRSFNFGQSSLFSGFDKNNVTGAHTLSRTLTPSKEDDLSNLPSRTLTPSGGTVSRTLQNVFGNSPGAQFAIGVELACNAIRHVDQLVSFIFLIHLFYFLAGTETAAGTTIKTGHIFDTQSAPIFLAVLSVILSAIVKIGTDGFWDYKSSDGTGKKRVVALLSFIAWVVSIFFLVLVIADIDEAVTSAKGDQNVDLYRSFYLAWIGYPIIAAFGMLVRLGRSCVESSYDGEIYESLSFSQDVLYGLLDAWCKGVLALWIAFTLFGVQLLNAPLAEPLHNH